MTASTTDLGATFRRLHEAQGLFLLPNPWDIGSAKILARQGFAALATTSAGFALSRGLDDYDVPFDAMIAHCKEIVGAVDLPVSADLGKGKGDSTDSAAETIFAAEAAGLAGCSIEDHTGDLANPIYDLGHAVERVAAAAEAARSLSRDFVLTARAENFLWDRPDLDDTIARLTAFAKAGADVVYAPGLRDHDRIRVVCEAVGKPVNVLAFPGLEVARLAQAGVKRISLGSHLAGHAYASLRGATREMLDRGTFDFARDKIGFADL